MGWLFKTPEERERAREEREQARQQRQKEYESRRELAEKWAAARAQETCVCGHMRWQHDDIESLIVVGPGCRSFMFCRVPACICRGGFTRAVQPSKGEKP